MSSTGTPEGCQIILVNNARAVLLQLRDEEPSIPFPGMWAIPGGMLEPGETARACIEREVHEELGVTLPVDSIRFLGRRQRSYGIENTFTAVLEADPRKLVLTEGQRVDWFLEHQTARMQLAYEDNAVLEAFFVTHAGIDP
ncbi:NUDIX hydrolase [Arthrobacter sp. NPDC092385]|uniref:NUDIX hydrolase n=1 Tax=Arthrobacter sp. NPDC092385 TaxID=3363943 RepID=UPI00382094BF